MMTEASRKRKQRLDELEEKRYGHVYRECEKRGCRRRFVECFETRATFFPIEQTHAFLDLRKNPDEHSRKKAAVYLREWKIYLGVLLDLFPDHEKENDWKEALRLLEDER